MQETWEGGKKSQKSVPKISWPTLGFTDSMTVEQARARAQQLNAQNSIKRAELMSVAKIAQRVERDRLHHSAFVPDDLNQQFLKWLDDNSSGSEKHREKVRIMWKCAKHAIITLQLNTEHFASNAKKIYRYFSANEYSLEYTSKIIGIMNQYGTFVGRLIGKYFEPVLPPRGADREMINDAYLDSESYYGPSEPLTPEILNSLRDKLKPEQHSWLKASLWFGLRPSELDAVLADRHQRVWRIEDGDQQPDVLWVYQPKLTSKPRHLRWKPIPILFDEQKEVLSIILEGGAASPLTQTLKKHSGRHITKYAGRKGFTDLMLEHGQKLEDIAQWLGHSSIEMTWQHYKDRSRVHYSNISKAKKS